jgi:diguanylate cyclase (GGDEF)-like protein/PAS domain S-box-containing protein
VNRHATAHPHEQSFADLFHKNPMPMWLFDPESLRFVEVNEAAVAKYGYGREEFLGMTLEQIRPPEDVDRLREHLGKVRPAPENGFRRSPGWRHLLKDGTTLWVDIYSYDIVWGEHQVRLVMVHDMTDLKVASERLTMQSAYFRQLFDSSPEAIAMLDHEDRIAEVNAAFGRLFQYSPDELRGKSVNEVIVPAERHQEASTLTLTALGKVAVQRDTVRRRRDGSQIEVSALGYPITVDGQQVGIFAIYRDITESKRIAAELAWHSTHDPVTGLINRHEFERLAKDLVQRAPRTPKTHAMLYMDVDQFKVINETLGHEAGDRLLLDLTEVIRAELREFDVLARLGGDEFGALLSPCDLPQAGVIAQRICDAVKRHRFEWDGRAHLTGVSIGVVEIGRETETLSTLLSAADTACYAAKERGRGCVQVFRADDQELLRMRGELSWATRLMDALEHDRFVLYYQRIAPVSAPADGTRYEVLLRMLGTDDTLIPPGLFIPAAERYGLMPAVDRRVITRVFRQLANRPAGDRVSVNLSGLSLSEEGLGAFIQEQLSRYRLAPERICFEITETSAVANLSRGISFIRGIRELGCSVALDDFGSGMSSFNYLKAMSFDYLKIDGGYVRDIVQNPLDAAMTEAINKVAQVKGIKTIAECVESAEALAKLGELGVDFAQGHYIHVPEPWEK